MSETTNATKKTTNGNAADMGLVARLASRGRALKDQLAGLTAENTKLAKQVQDLTAENSKLSVRADSSASAKRVEELTGELRSMKHRTVFDRLAAKHKVRPEAVEDLWQLSGYKAETDEIDEAAIETAIKGQVGKRAYLFAEGSPPSPGEPSKTTTTTIPNPNPNPGPGANRGGLATGAGKFTVTKSQLRDPQWMRANQSAYAAAIAKGEVEVTG